MQISGCLQQQTSNIQQTDLRNPIFSLFQGSFNSDLVRRVVIGLLPYAYGMPTVCPGYAASITCSQRAFLASKIIRTAFTM